MHLTNGIFNIDKRAKINDFFLLGLVWRYQKSKIELLGTFFVREFPYVVS
jgi:hypothetical protein